MTHDPATCRNGDHYGACGGATPARVAAEPEHFRGCHPEDDKASEAAERAEIRDTEDCWHCGKPTTRGACACPGCLDGEDYVPASAVYHCQTCGRWWAYMTGLNITAITFGEQDA